MKWSDTDLAKRFVESLPLSVLIKAIFQEGENLYFFGASYEPNSNLSLASFYGINKEWNMNWRVSRREFLKILDEELDLREHNWGIALRERERFYRAHD